MSVRPHPTKGDGWWVIDYYPDGWKGKRVRAEFEGRKGEALALEQELRRSPGTIKNSVAPSIKDLLPSWLQYYRNEVAPSAYADAVTTLKHWLPVFAGFKPAAITQQAINNYKTKRLAEITNPHAVARGEEGKFISKRTVNKELSYLSSCLRWAVQNGHCPDINFHVRGFSAKQTRASIPTVLTPRQNDKMYEVIDAEYKLLFLLMADMGLRREEAMAAKANDVDEFHQTLSVFGKGNKQRILPWTSDRFAAELRRTLGARADGYLTVNPKTGERYVQVRKALNRAAKRAGLARDVNPHLLRHICLTNLAGMGMSPHALQRFAGHSSIETTNRIYVHIRSDFVGDEVRRIRQNQRGEGREEG